ncbi:hypothetical protein NX059_002497 [Plenodomus lindquistii]|nr:hypothetical protein NX059_002497 [Plenodomus lindquistii]
MTADSRHLIEVRDAGPKGRGVFATANIPRGTRIIVEPALLSLELDRHNNKKTDPKSVLDAFNKLSPSQQDSFLQLHAFASDTFRAYIEGQLNSNWSDIPDLYRKVLSVYVANNHKDVYWLGSHINHSCIPSVSFAVNSRIGMGTFHTTRDIAVGEELSITYIDCLTVPCHDRQSRLQRQWGFRCTCLVCGDSTEGRQREAKRVMMASLMDGLAEACGASVPDWNEVVRYVKGIADIQELEDVLSSEMSPIYYIAAKACVMLQDARGALFWIEKQLELDRSTVGDDHIECVQGMKIVEILRDTVESSRPVEKWMVEMFATTSVALEGSVSEEGS